MMCPKPPIAGSMATLLSPTVAKLPIWGLTCGYFRDLWTEKSKLASMLVIWSPRGPRVPMAWGGCVGAAGYPMGCQIGRLTRHETPLAPPSQATKISKPNRFAYPFRSRPRGVGRPPILDLPPAKTPSYRDTANLGLGVLGRQPGLILVRSLVIVSLFQLSNGLSPLDPNDWQPVQV